MPYEEGLKECFGDIEKIMIKNEISSDIMKECENMLSLSCKNITDKWSKGRKYARTLFIIEAYQDEYPIQILETSVLIDAKSAKERRRVQLYKRLAQSLL